MLFGEFPFAFLKERIVESQHVWVGRTLKTIQCHPLPMARDTFHQPHPTWPVERENCLDLVCAQTLVSWSSSSLLKGP